MNTLGGIFWLDIMHYTLHCLFKSHDDYSIIVNVSNHLWRQTHSKVEVGWQPLPNCILGLIWFGRQASCLLFCYWCNWRNCHRFDFFLVIILQGPSNQPNLSVRRSTNYRGWGHSSCRLQGCGWRTLPRTSRNVQPCYILHSSSYNIHAVTLVQFRLWGWHICWALATVAYLRCAPSSISITNSSFLKHYLLHSWLYRAIPFICNVSLVVQCTYID